MTRPGRDATVITIAQVMPTDTAPGHKEPLIHIVEHYAWVGQNHASLYPQMVDILKNVWNCRYIAVDATGIGEPIASFLRQALGSKVLPFKFTQKSKSELGFDLLAAINSGRLKLYQQDGSADYEELMFELRKAQGIYRPNQTLNFFVDAADGHDDYLMSLTLAVHAASRCQPRIAKGRPRSP